MTKAKTVNLSAHDKVLATLMTGKPVEKKVFEKMFGDMSYKLSAYVLYCKNERTKAIIRANKDGRKVVSYQLMNPKEVEQYWTKRGISLDAITSLSDLNASAVEPVVTETKEVEKV